MMAKAAGRGAHLRGEGGWQARAGPGRQMGRAGKRGKGGPFRV